MLSRDDLVSADFTPNPLYHGHTGRVLRVMHVVDGPDNGNSVVEVLWDDPPVRHLSRQVISIDHLFRLGRLGDHVIQE